MILPFIGKPDAMPVEQSSYRNEGFLMLGEIVSGAESGDTSNDRILAVLRVGHIARYAPSLAPCYTPIMRRHSANLTVQMVLVVCIKRKLFSFSVDPCVARANE